MQLWKMIEALFMIAMLFPVLLAASANAESEIRSDHYDGKVFRNYVPDTRGFSDLLKWMFHREQGKWREWVDAAYGPRPPERVGDGRLLVTFVNHSTVLIQTENLNILTDPVWSERISPVSWLGPKRHRQPGIRFEDLPPIDAVLVSHNHYDHLDRPTLERLAEKHRAKFLTGLKNGRLILSERIKDVVELDWWQSVSLSGSVKAIYVPSRHFSNRYPGDRNQMLWGGFVIEGPSGKVYFAGDTGFGPHFQMIRDRSGPMRLAILPIGAYRPEWFMSEMHISPREAIQAQKILGAKTAVAIHYGTFALADDGETEPVDVLKKVLAEEGEKASSFLVLTEGKGYEIPSE